ncbi:hypothetical protein GSI_02327 [Ganoderma sinense ZZ0214-1]|uniref:Transporter n=1 Tax=Ganoderma sinense ZZ0214-1 TaxID=1077348 RepID=A0A2G8SPA9_9APHY|nr:hypothetical protein GSI_02327 [Ganoderma sinense ZZ0214-1]
MQSLSTCLVAAALLVAAVNAQFQINTPASITQCVPVQFSWTGGEQPYFLACVINPGGVTGAAALQQYTGLTGTSFTWSANISEGTSIGLQLTDSTGAIAQSAPVTIQSGPSNSCLTGETSAASGASTTAAGGTTSAANSGTSTTAPAASGSATKAATSGSASASGSKTSGSAASASTSASSGSNSALSNVASAGVVGLVGALAAALLA